MTSTKVLTIRVCQEDAARAEIAARVQGISVNEVFRLALVDYFAAKREDADFVDRARAMVDRDAAILGSLA